jgi:hypothetical protein
LAHDRNNGAGTGRQSRPGTFQRGNPGRPKGARNKATLAAMALLEGEAEALARKAVELALAGDTVALRLVLDRLLPRERAVRIALPMRSPRDLDRATGAIQSALAQGRVTVAEAGAMAQLVEARRRVLETTELERRLAALELGEQHEHRRAAGQRSELEVATASDARAWRRGNGPGGEQESGGGLIAAP